MWYGRGGPGGQPARSRAAAPPTTAGDDAATTQPDRPGDDTQAQRFLLHLLAENLDYLLAALDDGA